MALDLFSTHSLLQVQTINPPKATFLRDRYFPTGAGDIFPTKDVLIDVKDESGNVLAPVVLPSKGGIQVDRAGYETHMFNPPLIAPERPLTADELMSRLPGEALNSQKTPEERAAQITADDISELNTMIDNREEYMAAQVLLNNGYTLKQYADQYGSNNYIAKEIKFYTEVSNPAVYTPGANWSTASTAIMGDIAAMAKMLTKRGLPASDLVVSENVADVMIHNTDIKAMLDNRRYEVGYVEPVELPAGATFLMKLNCNGHMINVYSYVREYIDETTGYAAQYIPDNFVVMTAPNMGHTIYGAVTQLEGKEFVTYEGARVPHIIAEEHSNVRTLIQQAKPIVLPRVKNAAISAQVLGNA